jgi:mono/diheme cytochrome c family protein
MVDSMLRYLISCTSFTLLISLAMLGGCTDDGEAEAEADADADGTDSGLEGDVARGEELFAACAGCHGADGSGGIDINGTLSADLRVEVPELTDVELADIIENGDGPAMPPQYDDPQDIADVIAYLRSTFP